MNAVVRRIPRDQRLRITAKFNHETLQFEGNIFQLIERLMREQWTGKGEFSANQGDVYGLQFDFRDRVAQDVDSISVKNVLDTAPIKP